MKRYIRCTHHSTIYASTNMSDIPPIADESPEYWKLDDKITKEYESICPRYIYKNLFSGLYYRGKWKNTNEGIQFITTTWLTPNEPQYNKDILKPVPLKYVYRAVSVAEYQNILKTGQIKSNSSMNIGYEVNEGYTCYHTSFPGWYLPKDGGYILKINVTPDMFIDDVDEYIKTKSPVSINNIVEVNGLLV